MSGLKIEQVDEVFSAAEFTRVESAGLFRWWEYPDRRVRREFDIPAYIRAMFYEGRSELQVWVVLAWRGGRGHVDAHVESYVASQLEVEKMIRSMFVARQDAAVGELLQVGDHRLHTLKKLAAAANTEVEARDVLADALLERGVPF